MKTQLRLAMVFAIAACTLPTFAQNTGAATYTSKCQMCHGADGTGNTPAGKSTKVRPFNSPDVMKLSDDDLIKVTKSGKGKMPAYGGKLTDDQITAVIAHIHSLQK